MPPSDTLVQGLTSIVGADAVLTRAEDLIPYSFDGTAALRTRPSAVVFPRNAQVAEASTGGRPGDAIVTRGSGTGLSGGSLPCDCSVVFLRRWTRFSTWIAQPHAARGAGRHHATHRRSGGEAGLFYPPDPGSMRISTIGGNVAENSGGLRGLKYGVTRNYVMGLEVVFADGESAARQQVCEGCRRLLAARPVHWLRRHAGRHHESFVRAHPQTGREENDGGHVPSMDDAAETVSDMIAAQIIPCTLEFFDRTTIDCVEDFAKVGLPLDCEALLLMETDGHPAAVAEEAAKMEEMRPKTAPSNSAWRGTTPKHSSSPPRAAAPSPRSPAWRPTTILEDATVPRSELAKMIRFVAAMAAKYA